MPKLAILVVEDNPTLQSLMRLMSRRFDIEIEVAGSCEEALKFFTAGRTFDIVFMDWHLPGGTGLDCASFVRQADPTGMRHIPIIAMTASAMAGDRERCMEAGMDDYLSKPFTLDEFNRMLQKWMPHIENTVEQGNFGDEPGYTRQEKRPAV